MNQCRKALPFSSALADRLMAPIRRLPKLLDFHCSGLRASAEFAARE